MKTTSVIFAALLVLIFGGYLVYQWLDQEITRGGDFTYSRARLDEQSLEHAVTSFCILYGNYPTTLEELTKPLADGKPPIIKDASVIIDPWGRPYYYDPKQLHPKTEKPLIWSDGREPCKSKKITNWD